MAEMKEVSTVIFGSPEARDFAQIMPVVAQMPNLKVLEMNISPIPKKMAFVKTSKNLSFVQVLTIPPLCNYPMNYLN